MGEFETQIMEKIIRPSYYEVYTKEGIEHKFLDVPIEEIKDLIMEIVKKAKKEFPDYLMFDLGYSKNDSYITHQKWTLDEKNAFLKTERDKWFDKWFGD